MAQPQYERVYDPIRGVTYYSRSGNPPMVGVPGGGGCQDTQTLVPDLPFDFLQPDMRRQVTQVGYGGPFVIRSNPIGGLIDAIRNFCFPVPMQTTDGTNYTDLSGMGLGTYGDYTSQYPGDYGVGNYPGGSIGGVPQCGTDQTLDCSTGVCNCIKPTPAGGPSTTTTGGTVTPPMLTPEQMAAVTACSYDVGIYVVRAAASACGSDKVCLCTQANAASLCANAHAEGPDGAWTKLASDINKKAGVNCNDPRYQSAPLTPMKGGTTTGNLAAKLRNPLAAGGGILGGTPGGGTPAGGVGSIPGQLVTNPPPNPPKTIQSRGGTFFSRLFKPLPQTPNPATLTEGNIAMVASREPMGGSFDPARIYAQTFGRGVPRGAQRARRPTPPRGF